MKGLPSMSMTEDEQHRRLDLLDTVFRPSAPVDRADLFSGRGHQLATVQEAIGAVGQHAVIFGERGVGKTSLAATCVDITHHRRRIAMRINCDQSDSFVTLWQKVIDESPLSSRTRRKKTAPPSRPLPRAPRTCSRSLTAWALTRCGSDCVT